MKVRDWMSPGPVAVSPDTSVAEARRLLREMGFRHLPVVADDPAGALTTVRDRVHGFALTGMVSDRDVAIDPHELRTAVRRRRVEELVDDDRPVEAVMSSHPHVVRDDAEVSEAARLLLSRQIGALPVVDRDRRLVGIITAVDCLLAFRDFYDRIQAARRDGLLIVRPRRRLQAS